MKFKENRYLYFDTSPNLPSYPPPPQPLWPIYADCQSRGNLQTLQKENVPRKSITKPSPQQTNIDGKRKLSRKEEKPEFFREKSRFENNGNKAFSSSGQLHELSKLQTKVHQWTNMCQQDVDNHRKPSSSSISLKYKN